MGPAISRFSDWLSTTPASQFVQAQSWIIPTLQTLHILAIAVVLSSVAMLTLRVMGLAGVRTTIHDSADRYVPWIWGALIVLLCTGVILIVGEPNRDLNNRAFQIKMLLLILMAGSTLAFRRTVAANARLWDEEGGLSLTAKALVLAGFAAWLTIAVLGRWIAYALTE